MKRLLSVLVIVLFISSIISPCIADEPGVYKIKDWEDKTQCHEYTVAMYNEGCVDPLEEVIPMATKTQTEILGIATGCTILGLFVGGCGATICAAGVGIKKAACAVGTAIVGFFTKLGEDRRQEYLRATKDEPKELKMERVA
ncbi:MAG TPA: hypothetical protein O0X14_03500, partial [Methanocorpusculum sp.]|nr:hypothetical protein [Methanocorpusculum sp.]